MEVVNKKKGKNSRLLYKVGGVFLILVFIVLGFWLIGILGYSGVFDKTITTEEMQNNFINHEKEFFEVVTYFDSIVPKDKGYTVSFRISSYNKVNLLVRMNVVNKTIGGDSFSQLDSASTLLGWTNETIEILSDKLSKTNCNLILTKDTKYNPIELYPEQSGWIIHKYIVINSSNSNNLPKEYGQSISNTSFGKRVWID